jgi:hypothetical protein
MTRLETRGAQVNLTDIRSRLQKSFLTACITLLSKKISVNDTMHMSGHDDYNSMRPYIAVDTKRLKNYNRDLSGEGGM